MLLKLNVLLLIFTVLGLVSLFDCSDVVSSRELAKKTKDTVLLSNLIKLNGDYVKHLLYHPFHRLHKKHLLHRQRKHPYRSRQKSPNQKSPSKRKTNKKQSSQLKKRLTSAISC